MKSFALILLFILSSLLVACDGDETAPVEKDIGVINSDLNEEPLQYTHQLENGIVFTTQYTAPSRSRWRITDNKTLQISAWADVPDGTVATVLIEHLHVDTSLQSSLAIFDGWGIDSMDDSIHEGTVPGFLASDGYTYNEVFSIEGYSERLFSGWGYRVGEFGVSKLSEKRLTEENLRNDGKVFGMKFVLVYDVLIRYEGEEFFHKLIVSDEFLVAFD